MEVKVQATRTQLELNRAVLEYKKPMLEAAKVDEKDRETLAKLEACLEDMEISPDLDKHFQELLNEVVKIVLEGMK